MYTTLIFDLDGTLTDSGLGIMRCAQFALSHFGIHVEDYTTLRNFVGPPLEDSFIDFYGFTPEQADEAVGIYRERYFTTGVYENEVYPGTVDALQELQRRGYRMGLWSSRSFAISISPLISNSSQPAIPTGCFTPRPMFSDMPLSTSALIPPAP